MEWKATPLVVLQLLCHIGFILSFNLYTEDPVMKEGFRDSYFGFSVAQHIRSTPNEAGDSLISEHLLLVGAPKDNITDFNADPEIRNLRRPGAVYWCPISSSQDDCEQVKLMRGALLRNAAGDLKEDRSDQWLGVSVSSQGTPEGMALACAHRYKIQDFSSNYIRGPGMCLSISNVLDEEDFLDPCSSRAKNSRYGHGDYAFCAAGTSCDLNEEGRLLLGTPGVYNWHGEVMKNIIAYSLTESQKWYESPHKDDDTQPPALTTYYSYFGMAVIIAKLFDNRLTYVAGAPRSKDIGEVFLLSQVEQQYYESNRLLDVEPHHILTGEQFGSGFGYALAAGDYNGDGLQDLVVGAPFYHGDGVGGVIYVYMNSEQGIRTDTEPLKITSRQMTQQECKSLDCQNARFGFSLGNMGDADRDGYDDLAVGAPFEGAGVLYVFRGSEDGLMTEYAQRIAATDLDPDRPAKSFGYSVTGGKDVDDNTYPDLVVGAYEAAKVYVFRSRPVVDVFTQMAASPSMINATKERCETDGRMNNCFRLRICFKFSAQPMEKFRERLSLNYRLEAETFTGRSRSRVFFRGAPDDNNRHVMERTIRLHEQSSDRCKDEELLVYIVKGNTDFLNPVNFQLTYAIDQRVPPPAVPGGPLADLNTYPVLNDKASVSNFSVEFHKNCGIDKTCDSQLRLDARFELQTDTDGVPILKLGQDVEPRLNIRVQNLGEDAHEATLHLTLPEALSYIGVSESGKKYSCLPGPDNMVSCVLGNPLMRHQLVDFAIRLNPSKLKPSTRGVDVSVRVNTTSKEVNETDDLVNIRVRVVVETDLLVRGLSEPDVEYFGGEVVGESAIRYEDQIGSPIVHTYEVKNEGKGRVANSTVWVWWPYEVENNYPQGKHLLYLTERPLIEYENGVTEFCDLDPKLVNPLGIKKRPGNQRKRFNTTQVERSPRVRRESVVAYESRRDPETGKTVKVVQLDCESKTAKCFKFPCVVGELWPRSSVIIILRSRLWNATFLEDYTDVDEVRILSKAMVKIDEKLNVKQTDTTNDVAYAETRAIPDILVKEQEGIPLWVIIVSVVAGILLLIIIIVLLWKCGFFKRKTAEDMRKHKANLEKQKHTKKTGKKNNKDYYN